MVKTCHVQSDTLNILPILHVFPNLVRKVRIFLTPRSPLSAKISNWPTHPRPCQKAQNTVFESSYEDILIGHGLFNRPGVARDALQ